MQPSYQEGPSRSEKRRKSLTDRPAQLPLTHACQRLSAKTNLNLAKLWLDRKEYGRLHKVRTIDTQDIERHSSLIQLIRDLHAATNADGEDQAQKGTQLLEIYALEIQMWNETKNYKKLKVRTAIRCSLVKC